MSDGGELAAAQISALTASADISAPPPDGVPVALVLFGTNKQDTPVRIAAERYHRGTAPLIIATGGGRSSCSRSATARGLVLVGEIPAPGRLSWGT